MQYVFYEEDVIMAKQFKWIDFYTEFASKIMEYSHERPVILITRYTVSGHWRKKGRLMRWLTNLHPIYSRTVWRITLCHGDGPFG